MLDIEHPPVGPLMAGTHELYFNLVGNASGNIPGNRVMQGNFILQIGNRVPNPILLPAPVLLLANASPWLLSAKRKGRSTAKTG
jgi:hypothetical protein